MSYFWLFLGPFVDFPDLYSHHLIISIGSFHFRDGPHPCWTCENMNLRVKRILNVVQLVARPRASWWHPKRWTRWNMSPLTDPYIFLRSFDVIRLIATRQARLIFLLTEWPALGLSWPVWRPRYGPRLCSHMWQGGIDIISFRLFLANAKCLGSGKPAVVTSAR